MTDPVSILVVGSVNLDIVATAEKLPSAGETVTGAVINRFPGGKGANQALAANRLGAKTSLIACVGNDTDADSAMVLLVDGGVDLAGCTRHESASTGVALISVGASGENQIVVAPGANRRLTPAQVSLPSADAIICQLEVPVDTIEYSVGLFDGFVCLNLAPATEIPEQLIRCADLLVVNETEAEFYGPVLHESDGLVAETFGARGARLSCKGKTVARARPPLVEAVDTTGAGDTFTAALTVALVEGQNRQTALEFACVAGAAAATKAGAQPSLPLRSEVEELMG